MDKECRKVIYVRANPRWPLNTEKDANMPAS